MKKYKLVPVYSDVLKCNVYYAYKRSCLYDYYKDISYIEEDLKKVSYERMTKQKSKYLFLEKPDGRRPPN